MSVRRAKENKCITSDLSNCSIEYSYLSTGKIPFINSVKIDTL